MFTLGIVCGLIFIGNHLFASKTPRHNRIILLSPPTPFPIKGHIFGRENQSGVYASHPNIRIQEAIDTAGGYQQCRSSQV
jgi:hypothetical protein